MKTGDDVIFGLLNKFASIIIFITAAILTLDVLGVNIMPFIAGAGVAGIAIGFAAKEIITGISLELDWVMQEPAPKVVVKSFGDSAINLEVRIWISKPRRRMDTISHITDRVKGVFQKEGIEITFPKRDIYIKKEKEVQ